MKKALITGADGFIGSHLTEYLVHKGYKVKALAQYNSFNSWGWLESVDCKNDIEVITGDIRDADVCNEITKNVDVVFHLAALIAIPYSYLAPKSYCDTNILGTVNMCRASQNNGVQKFMNTSTSEVYGTAQYVPINEKHPLQPQSPYSASKISADAMAMSFYNAFKLPVTTVRPFNTYGPRQSARAIIPTIISQIASGYKQIKLGSTSPTRDFNYVKDTCRGFHLLANNENTTGKTINIGSDTEISIGDLCLKIQKLMGKNIEVQTDEQRLRPESSEVNRLWCDNSLIKELVQYEPEYNLDKGLQITIDWFLDKENLKKYKADIYNV